MAKIIELKEFNDERGFLTVIQSEIAFEIKRVFYITGADGYVRGGHRHHNTKQLLVCIHGSCVIYNNNGVNEEEFLLDDTKKALLLEPEDWHIMKNFKDDAVLLVLASTGYDVNDYIDEPYD